MSIARKNAVSCCSALMDHCLCLNSPRCAQYAHAHLIKEGLRHCIFLGNRLIDLYSQAGAVGEAVEVFRELPDKNIFTWNILLAALCKSGSMERAIELFEEMPARDVVSWNSLISCYAATGLEEKALVVLIRMQELGVRANSFTISVVASCVSSVCKAKEVHGHAIRSYMYFWNVVVGNAFINMYGRLGVVHYARFVFLSMRLQDIISWNSMILAYERSGHTRLAQDCFKSMRHAGFFPDMFTMSILLSVCAGHGNLVLGELAFAFCLKVGHLSNSMVSSGVIDVYSQCGRLDDSVRFFHGVGKWDIAICNSMISTYVRHGSTEEAMKLMVLALKNGLKPTGFTYAIILSSISSLDPIVLGTQVHSLALKSGFETDIVISSSLLKMYSAWGAIECSLKIFRVMAIRDLVCWNTMIKGFAENGQCVEALGVFKELLMDGARPDRITLTGILTACSLGALVKQGTLLFSSMEAKYGIRPGIEHYVCMVDMLGRAGMLTEAIEFIKWVPQKICPSTCLALLDACIVHGNLGIAEIVAQKTLELRADASTTPYSVLVGIYGARGEWERVAEVRRAMTERGARKEISCSWIAVRSQIFSFRADQLLHHGGESLYSMLSFLGDQVLEVVKESQTCTSSS